MTDLRLFLNRLKTLSAIDRDEFELAIGDFRLPFVDVGCAWSAFRDNPVRWFLYTDDQCQAALWRIMTGRFPG